MKSRVEMVSFLAWLNNSGSLITSCFNVMLVFFKIWCASYAAEAALLLAGGTMG